MSKFLVMYLAPAATMDEWMKKPQEERADAEKKMMEDWNAWMAAHKDIIKETMAAGKTKKVSAEGASDHRNDLMLYSVIEAEDHETAAKTFEGHPHLGIPGATIEIVAIRPM